MRKFTIGQDVDGVLYRWGRAARDSLLERFGLDIPETVWLDSHLMNSEQWTWLWSDEGVRRTFGRGHAFPGAIAGVKRLATLGTLHVITAAPESARVVRVEWLRRRGVPFDEISFVGYGGLKSDVLPHCDVYLDDSPKHVVDLVEHTRAVVLLFDHSWNRDELAPPNHKRIWRVYDWNEAFEAAERVKEG